MEEVNDCIAANAETEELVDKPEIVKDTIRVSGPFSMEGVIAVEEGPDSPIGGAPEELDTFAEEDQGDLAVANAEAHLDKIIRLLKASGVDFPGNKNLKFGRLDPTTGATLVHAEGEWVNGADAAGTVAVSIGPGGGQRHRDAGRGGGASRQPGRVRRRGFRRLRFRRRGAGRHRERRAPEASSPYGADQSGRGDGRSAQDAAGKSGVFRLQRAAGGRPDPAR